MESLLPNSIINRMRSFCVVDVVPPVADSSIPFQIDTEKLMQLVKTKDPGILEELGGVEGIISALKSNPGLGIHGNDEDLCCWRNVFGSNGIQNYGVSLCLYELPMLLRGRIDYTTAMVTICALYLIFLGIRLYGRDNGWKPGAYALGSVYLFNLLNKTVELGIKICFRKVMERNDVVLVFRNGLKRLLPSSEVVVGDVLFVNNQGMVPADGLLLDAIGDQPLKFDESHLLETACAVEVDSANPFLRGGGIWYKGKQGC